MLSLKTLHNVQIQLVESGLLPEDVVERCNVIAYDIKRVLVLHQKQMEAVLELLPETFDPVEAINEVMSKPKRKKKHEIHNL